MTPTRAACVAALCVALPAQDSRPATMLALEATETLRVVVYENATKKPLRDAQVLYLHEEDRRQAMLLLPREWDALSQDLELRLERFGRSTLTGDDGVAFLPRKGLVGDGRTRTETEFKHGQKDVKIEIVTPDLPK